MPSVLRYFIRRPTCTISVRDVGASRVARIDISSQDQPMTRRRIASVVALSTALSFASVRALLADNKPNSNGAAQKAAALEPASNNTLTEKEKAEGWKLLFDGRDLNGWHNFKKTDVRPGWQVKDG